MYVRWKWREMQCALVVSVCALVVGGCASWQGPRIDPTGEQLLLWPGQPTPTFTPTTPPTAVVTSAPGAPPPPPIFTSPAPTSSSVIALPPPPVGLPNGNLQAPPAYPDAGLQPSLPPVITTPPPGSPPLANSTVPLAPSAVAAPPALDAQWAFPSSTVAQAGRALVLTTIVTRRSDRAPLAGWTVRYEVRDSNTSAAGGATRLVEATTDASGRASVEVSPTTAGNGVATVIAAIVPPADIAGTGPAEVARSTATITWSGGSAGAPPAVMAGPVMANPTFSSPGTSSPSFASPDRSSPSGSWSPRQSSPYEPPPSLSSETPATRSDPYGPPPPLSSDSTPPRTFAPPPRQESTGKPELSVDVRRRSPPTVQVGGFAAFEVVVTNRGTAAARNIVVLDRFDKGLSHTKAVGDELAVKYENMRDLEPGASAIVPLTFGVRDSGEQCHEVTVTAEGATAATGSGCVTAVAAQPAMPPTLEVIKIGPIQHRVGEEAKFRVVIKNTGEVPVTNLIVVDSYDDAFEPRFTDPGREILSDGSFQWKIPRLERGERREFNVRAMCVTPSRSACSRVIVTADGGLNYAEEKCVEILPAPTAAVN